MLQHFLRDSTDTHTSHRFLIGAPLVLAVVFSFAFVSLQPVGSTGDEPTASKTTAASVSGTSAQAPAALPDMPLAETNLPTLDQAIPTSSDVNGATSGVGNSAASVSDTSSRIKTANPQQATKKSSAPNSTSPQTTSSARYYIDPKQPINVQINIAAPSLTNFQ